MTEEIKEILDDMKQIPIDESWALNLEDYQCKLLLNYITNLQKENEKLKDELYSTNQVVNELLDIQSRNEKAIKYIITNKPIYIEQKGTSCIIKVTDVLLNILQGGDE